MPEKTRDGKMVRMGDNPEVMPGSEDTYQSYGLWWATASDTPFRKYKGWVHEGGIATPLIIHWPNNLKRKGEFERQLGHIIDIMPTVLDIANVRYPKQYGGKTITPLEGLSLVPAFRGKTITRPPLFWEHEGNAAVRVGQWKLVRLNAANGEGAWELYDMITDRTETMNVADVYPERVKEMAAMWKTWSKRVGVLPWEELRRRMRRGINK